MEIKDVLVEGEPARIVCGMDIPGATIRAKTLFFREKHDALRQSWTIGNAHQGAVLVDPTEGGDTGAIFFNADGYPNMCGHLSMAIGHTFNYSAIDTSAGQVKVRKEGELMKLTNVPCYYHSLIETDVPAFGVLPLHLVFGGDFFLLCNVDHLPLLFRKEHISELSHMALHIFWDVKSKVHPKHPLRPWIDYIDVIMLYKQEAERRYITLTAWGKDEYDLCPCGTGTSALAAMLYYFRMLGVGDRLKNVSLAGNEFEAKVLSVERLEGYTAVVPEISGKVTDSQGGENGQE